MTLADAITISGQVESAIRESKIIGENSNHATEADVNAVSHRTPHKRNCKPRQRKPAEPHQSSQPAAALPQISCTCGEQSHKANLQYAPNADNLVIMHVFARLDSASNPRLHPILCTKSLHRQPFLHLFQSMEIPWYQPFSKFHK